MTPPDDTPPDLSSRRQALVVTGCSEDRGRIESLLARQHVLALSADAAEPAIDLLSTQPVDLVICDITLRGRQEGLDVGRWLRQHQPQTGLVLLADSFPWIPANSPVAGVPILIRPLDWAMVAKKITWALSSTAENLASRAA